MIHKPKTLPIVLRDTLYLKRVHDFDGCYILLGSESKGMHIQIFRGERMLTQLYGRDTFVGGGWRGSATDYWGADFGYDFKSALKWLHESEDGIDDTLSLWTDYKYEDYND